MNRKAVDVAMLVAFLRALARSARLNQMQAMGSLLSGLKAALAQKLQYRFLREFRVLEMREGQLLPLG